MPPGPGVTVAKAVKFADPDGLEDLLGDVGGLDLSMITELTEFDPDRMDGVDLPASGFPALLLKRAGDGKRGVPARLVKTVAERRFGLYVAYPAGKADVSVAADGARDFAGAEAVEHGAWSFLQKGGRVGLFHAAGTDGAGTVVESSVHRAPPWTLTAADGSTQTVHPGDWLVGIVWDEPAWELVKSGRITGVSMQGSAKRRKPSAEALAALRKQAKKEDVVETLRKAARAAVEESTAPVRAQLGDLGKRLDAVEKARRPQCRNCGKRAKHPESTFCTKCGFKYGSVAKSAAVTAADARLLGDVITKAQRRDPAALVRLTRAYGAETAIKLVNGEALLSEVGGSLAKAAAALEGDGGEAGECRTCDGRGRLRHPVTGKASRTCPSCQGTGNWTPDGDEAGLTGEDASLVREYTRRATGKGTDAPDAIGRLTQMLGPDIAARIVSGESFSPAEFQRGYITACRANQSARPGQEPRIPLATHVISPDDFRGGPIGLPRQQRPAPASRWPGSGGQADYYGQQGPGTGTRGSLAGLGDTQTGPTAALPARTGW